MIFQRNCPLLPEHKGIYDYQKKIRGSKTFGQRIHVPDV